MERKLKPKTVALLKSYLDSDQTKVTCDENPFLEQLTDYHMILKQLILNEIIEMINIPLCRIFAIRITNGLSIVTFMIT